MFDSLDETMKHDAAKESTPRERIMRYVVTGVITAVVLAGLLMGVRFMQ